MRFLCVLVSVLAWALPAHSLTFNADPELMKFDTLVARSRVAAVLTVDQVRYRWLGTRLVTDYTCHVTAAGYGVDEGEQIVVTQPGGYWGVIGQKVIGLESFMPNDQLAVLLGDRGYLSGGRAVIGMSLGAWRVVDAAVADDTPMTALHTVDSVLRDAVAAPTTVGEFLRRVRSSR